MMQNGVNMDEIGGKTENGWHRSSPIWEVSMFTSFLSITPHLRIYSIVFLYTIFSIFAGSFISLLSHLVLTNYTVKA